MNDFEDNNRQLLPRWVPFSNLNVLTPFATPNDRLGKSEFLKSKTYFDIQREWKLKHTVPLATEIIFSSHLSDATDTELYREAFDYLVNSHEDVLESNLFIQSILGRRKQENCSLEEKTRKDIHRLRLQSRLFPSDSSIWIDLVYFYSCLGQNKKADEIIKFALAANPQDVFTVRSLAKYFLLRNDPERAQNILVSNDNLRLHPLIISSEVSISQKYKLHSKLLRNAKSLTKYLSLSNPFENELFATMGTFEFNAENSKKGLKLFNQALLFPNENIIAQGRFIANKFNKDIDFSDKSVPCRFETDAWIAYRNSDFEKVVDETRNWFYFQPFSPESAVMNTYIKSLIFGKDEESIEMAKNALKINKDSFSLQNNLVVSYFRNNQINEANNAMIKLRQMKKKDNVEDNVLLATEGLFNFRNNNIELGNNLYKEALEGFRKAKDVERQSRLLYYWGWECREKDIVTWQKLILESYDIAKSHNLLDLKKAIENNFKNLVELKTSEVFSEDL